MDASFYPSKLILAFVFTLPSHNLKQYLKYHGYLLCASEQISLQNQELWSLQIPTII